MHEVLVNCLGGLPRNIVARLTDRARNDLKCVEGRKTQIKPNQFIPSIKEALHVFTLEGDKEAKAFMLTETLIKVNPVTNLKLF